MIINEMSGGGGAFAFGVVGGTTTPTSPAENTIWVNTSTALGTAYIQTEYPASPANGDVLVRIDGHSPLSASAGWCSFGLSDVRQYVGGAWVRRVGKLYASSAWIRIPDMLIGDGYIDTVLIGDITGSDLSYVAGYLAFGGSISSYGTARVSGSATIPADAYDILSIDVQGSGLTSAAVIWCGAAVEQNPSSTASYYAYAEIAPPDTTNNVRKKVITDVAGGADAYYFGATLKWTAGSDTTGKYVNVYYVYAY